jgi:hypothetical protein
VNSFLNRVAKQVHGGLARGVSLRFKAICRRVWHLVADWCP